MERLTCKCGNAVVFPSELVGVTLTPDNAVMHGILERLAEYEDAEAEGRIVRLPCKVGDTVYQVGASVTAVSVYESKIQKIIWDVGHFAFDEQAIGESVFLTRAEAEAEVVKRIGGAK